MATYMFNDGVIFINGVDLSDWCTSIDLPLDVAELDDTHMGDSWTEVIAGMKSVSCTVNFSQDFAASAVDATLWAAHGTVVAVRVRATSGAIATTNPEYQFNALVKYGSPVGGQVGSKASTSCTLTGSGAVTRDVTP